jgi:glycosyltransferase involved in cell wall biosynthesis
MPAHSRPVASIVRVLDPAASHWNELGHRRLLKHTSVPCEILDCALEASYGAAVNRGAAQARAEQLVVMQGDTLVGPDWLEPLLSAASRGDAAVTPCVTGVDGAVQAAGYLATRRGELIPFGRGSTAADSFSAFVRDVASPSPACFLVTRRAFLAAGAFDTSIEGPPQLETADLAFALRARGQRVLFQPASTVQSGAAPGDAGSYSLGPALRRRWSAALAQLPASTGSGLARSLVELRDGHTAARLLVVDDRVPHLDRGGGDPRMHRLLMELASSWPDVRVTLFALMPDNGARYARGLRQAGVEVVYGEPLGDWLSSRPFYYDVVMISRPRPVLDQLRATQPQARFVYDMEAVHVRRHQRMMEVAPPDAVRDVANAIRELLPLEVGLIADADAVLCVSEDDRAFARVVAPSTPSFLVCHASDPPDEVPPFDDRRDIVFFGAFWNPGSPNEDAALYLARRVMPFIWAEDPSIRLVIIGADPTPAVRDLDEGNISVRGYVSDPSDVLTRARVLIVPMRVGAGVKLRLIDAMAAGLPFVTTTVGAEGLPLADLRPLIVADAPIDIARRALTLYRDRDLWTQVQHTLRDRAATCYSTRALRRELVEAMMALGFAPPAAG